MPRPDRIFVEGGIYHVYNRLGRGERVFNQETAVRERREREERGPEWRPLFEAKEFIVRGAKVLGVEVEALRSRRQDRRLARARELLMVLGVERYRLKLKDLARELKKSPDGMTKAVVRAAKRRVENDDFLTDLNALDQALACDED